MDEFWFWVSPYLWQTGPRIFRWCRAGPLGIDRVDDLPIGRAAAGLPASTQPGGWTPGEPVTTAEPTARSRLSTPTVGLADIPARWTPAGSGVRCVLAGLISFRISLWICAIRRRRVLTELPALRGDVALNAEALGELALLDRLRALRKRFARYRQTPASLSADGRTGATPGGEDFQQMLVAANGKNCVVGNWK